MAKGTIKADFAGTYDEAVEYAREHGFRAAKSLAHGPVGPMISLPYSNYRELNDGLKKFDEHGWDRGSVIVTVHGWRPR